MSANQTIKSFVVVFFAVLINSLSFADDDSISSAVDFDGDGDITVLDLDVMGTALELAPLGGDYTSGINLSGLPVDDPLRDFDVCEDGVLNDEDIETQLAGTHPYLPLTNAPDPPPVGLDRGNFNGSLKGVTGTVNTARPFKPIVVEGATIHKSDFEIWRQNKFTSSPSLNRYSNGDANLDGKVDEKDLFLFLGLIVAPEECPYDYETGIANAHAQQAPIFTVFGDLNSDEARTYVDLDILCSQIGTTGNTSADLNEDGTVTGDDVFLMRYFLGVANRSGTGPILIGDANADGYVNGSDFLAWNWQYNNAPNGTVWSEGDFNHDGVTDLVDYRLLLDNWMDDIFGE